MPKRTRPLTIPASATKYVRINDDCLIAPGYLAITDDTPHAITGLISVTLIAKWHTKNDVLLRRDEYTVATEKIGAGEMNSIDKLILSQIISNGRWLLKRLDIVDLRVYVVAECKLNCIKPTTEEIDEALVEEEE